MTRFLNTRLWKRYVSRECQVSIKLGETSSFLFALTIFWVLLLWVALLVSYLNNAGLQFSVLARILTPARAIQRSDLLSLLSPSTSDVQTVGRIFWLLMYYDIFFVPHDSRFVVTLNFQFHYVLFWMHCWSGRLLVADLYPLLST